MTRISGGLKNLKVMKFTLNINDSGNFKNKDGRKKLQFCRSEVSFLD